jgi:hypothetical protein
MRMRRLLPLIGLVLLFAHCGGTSAGPSEPPDPTTTLLAALDPARFRSDVAALSQFGDRTQGTQRNVDALAWIEAELRSYGYTNVERHAYVYLGQPRENIYVTKVGVTTPGEMYIVSAHMDGRGAGQASDDDASGCALLLEAARVVAGSSVTVARSVRFIFWNNEETGLNGSAAYAADRFPLQGIESPAGSGKFPEPRWLGVIQHDMVMFDHGLPPAATQSPTADLDIEYQATSAKAAESAALVEALRAAGAAHAATYPMDVGSDMNNTDSKSFQDLVASVSVRENKRVAEIGAGANPHWHKATDLYATYDDADFAFGFNTVKMTVSAIVQLAGARITNR